MFFSANQQQLVSRFQTGQEKQDDRLVKLEEGMASLQTGGSVINLGI